MPFNTITVGVEATRTVCSTFLSHYFGKKSERKGKPTASFSYHTGLCIVRRFLRQAAYYTIEEFQAFTARRVPSSRWIRHGDAVIPAEFLVSAAHILIIQLGPDGVSDVGGSKWWQWRGDSPALSSEWIETKRDFNERRSHREKSKRIILYLHGGAYFFGSVDTHRYQLQRHARKLKARVFARLPFFLSAKFRLAPQFPFPCALQDCIASYLYLLSIHKPEEIIVAGDSSGGGMVVSLLVTLRDQKIPLPAGGILISPWLDLTHSFPSVASESPDDYLPVGGFMHRPSLAWPPPNVDEYGVITGTAEKILQTINDPPVQGSDASFEARAIEDYYIKQAQATAQSAHLEKFSTSHGPNTTTVHQDPSRLGQSLRVDMGDTVVEIRDQIHMYTTNQLLSHPLVSPVLQPSLGGLPPLLVLAGGGEMLQDEQIYLAHKAADPTTYPPSAKIFNKHDPEREIVTKYPPTYVQLQVWDGVCHVVPTLSFTKPAKFMFRSIAQFGAWALSRAQGSSIDIPDVSTLYSSDSAHDLRPRALSQRPAQGTQMEFIGKAGDPLPPFYNYMIRQVVDKNGYFYPLVDSSNIPGLMLPPSEIGEPKPRPVQHWLTLKQKWDTKFARQKRAIQRRRIKEVPLGIDELEPGERPPPSSLAARRGISLRDVRTPTKKSRILSAWSKLGTAHDDKTIRQESKEIGDPEKSLFPGVDPRSSQGGAPGSVSAPRASSVVDPRASLIDPRTSVIEPRASHTRVVTDLGQSSGFYRGPGGMRQSDASQYPTRGIYDEKWSDGPQEDRPQSRASQQDGLFSASYNLGRPYANNVESLRTRRPTEPDQASSRAVRHATGISQTMDTASSHADWETPKESTTPVQARSLREKPLRVHDKTLNSKVPPVKPNEMPGTTSAGKGDPKGKEKAYNFDSAERASPTTEPFPPLPRNESGDLSDAHSGYSSHYSNVDLSHTKT